MKAHLDAATWLTVIVTLILFAFAVVVKGFGHDLSLEAAVFLISVKLVLMTYKIRANTEMLVTRLDSLKTSLDRIERLRDRTESR